MKHKWNYNILYPIIAMVGVLLTGSMILLWIALEYRATTGDWF